MSDLDAPLLDVVREQLPVTDYDYDDLTDNELPLRTTNKKKKHNKTGKHRRPSRAITTNGLTRRIYATCVGENINTDGISDGLQDTGWIVRSQPYGCVYCYRRNPSSPTSPTRRKRVTSTSKQNSNSELYAEGGADGEAGEGEPKTSTRTEVQHIFFFDFGCVVCWGCKEEEEKNILRRIDHLIENPASSAIQIEEDDMTFIYGQSVRLKNGSVVLSSTNPIEKFAISLAFAQSTKLNVYEGNVNTLIEESRKYPEALALTGEIPLTQRAVSKKIGELFIVRYKIFLGGDMLETPEFFWESDEYEPVYNKARKYLDVEKRLGVLNQRLEIVRELFEMLANALENNHANRLEFIIVVLIFAEVGLQLLFGLVDLKCLSFCGSHGDF